MDRVSLRLPSSLLAALDGVVEDGLYADRSEAIRQAIRDLVAAHDAGPAVPRAAPDGGAAVAAGCGDQTNPDTRRLTRLPPQALEGRTLECAFERGGQYQAVAAQIVTVRDGGDRDRRRFVLADGTVVPVAGLLGYDLSATRGERDV